MSLLGATKILQNSLCVEIKVTWHVVRHPIRKRRRNWRVERREARNPCCYQLADGTLVMHPEIYRQLMLKAQSTRQHHDC